MIDVTPPKPETPADVSSRVVGDEALFRTLLAAEKRRLITASNTGENLPRALVFVLAGLIAWGNGRNTELVIWVLAMICVPGPALLAPRWFYALPDRQFWPACIIIGGVAYPLGWTVLAMLSANASTGTQWIVLFYICMAVTIRARVSAYNPPEMYAQILVSMGSLAAWEAASGAEHGWLIAMILGIVAMVLIAYGRAAYGAFVNLVRLTAQNIQLADRLEKQTTELRQANAAKTRFLASASHDMRQPMHSIGLLVGLLQPRMGDPTAADITRRIAASVAAMEDLLNGILNISQLEAGIERPEVKPVQLRLIFQNLERAFGMSARKHGLEIRWRGGSLWVASDAHLLLRILGNLLSNAVKYTRSGGILVAGRVRGDQVLLEVWDTGIGIPPDSQAEVFDEFVQLHNAERDRSQGLGLGLAIVRRTAQLLEHPLQLQSRPGRGTVVRLALPRVAVPMLECDANAAPLPADASGLYVLLVDDERDIRFAMHGLLADWGCTVLAASSAEDVLQQLDSRLRPPDAMLIDYRLAGESGVALAGRLHALLNVAPPTMVVTGDVTSEPLKEIAQSGFDVMHKPVSPLKLRQWLAAVKNGLGGDLGYESAAKP